MSYLITYSGKRIDIPHPSAANISIVDIGMHLSRIPRFVGATQEPWSVAEHSVLVMHIAALAGLSPIVQLAALMHDAHEAYFSDIPSPVKASIKNWECGPNYGLGRIESALQTAVLKKFGVYAAFHTLHDEIRKCDLIALATERRDLMHPAAMLEPWPVLEGIEALVSPNITPISPGKYWGTEKPFDMFLSEYHRLIGLVRFGTDEKAAA